ncbi:hypothetical protein LC087_17770 [Bacillus carboniphilus]|uniref:Uncharacterized protein n=1 Tax=Bacillus carboniphilus TaxID=86663 RepID=A0ABY9JY20_9BACI|nr:hypothetical protein [Bacillus carboniphilus]WLR42515.1 hypothetical protein LC087_17770 [Bacillus carboniphilus]
MNQQQELLESYEYYSEKLEGIEDTLIFLVEKLRTGLDNTLKSKKRDDSHLNVSLDGKITHK